MEGSGSRSGFGTKNDPGSPKTYGSESVSTTLVITWSSTTSLVLCCRFVSFSQFMRMVFPRKITKYQHCRLATGHTSLPRGRCRQPWNLPRYYRLFRYILFCHSFLLEESFLENNFLLLKNGGIFSGGEDRCWNFGILLNPTCIYIIYVSASAQLIFSCQFFTACSLCIFFTFSEDGCGLPLKKVIFLLYLLSTVYFFVFSWYGIIFFYGNYWFHNLFYFLGDNCTEPPAEKFTFSFFCRRRRHFSFTYGNFLNLKNSIWRKEISPP